MRSSSPTRIRVGTSIAARPLALVGQPHRRRAEAIGGRVDRGHRLDHLGAQLGRRGAAPSSIGARASASSRIVIAWLAATERSWIPCAVGMDREAVGDDQRGAALGRGGMHGDGDHAAQRQAADMGALDAERVHRGEDRRRQNRRASRLGAGSLSP